MLAVLKKRWKPKRATANNANNNNNGRRSVKSLIIESNTMQLETGGEKIRVSVSPRQVHPVSEICPAPNICVQGGRIEFIRPNQGTPDHVKDKLEARIAELEALLEEEKKSTLKERRNTARFQALIEDRESLAKDVEYERGVRQKVESKLEEASQEADHSKRRIVSLQETCHRLEDSLRSMSLYKTKYAQLKAENASLNKAIESRMQQYQSTFNKLTSENEDLKSRIRTLETAGSNEEKLRARLEEVEEENARLIAERSQCEKCLDQVAHQVVQALLAQKGLREEISSLKDKVKELEKQNYTLSSLLLQQLPKETKRDTSVGSCQVRPVSCDDARLKWRDSILWLPVHRPSSLNLENPRLISSTDNQTEFHKDEGYSTMSSEVQCEAGGQEEKTESPRRLTRSNSEPGLSGLSDEPDWWEQVWVTDSRIDFDAPPELEEWTMDDIPGLSWLVEDEVWLSSQMVSPGGDSWSSQGTTSEGSKRSSTMSEGDCQVGTHFTSDFYRLVKFESTKSLASTSSRSQSESVSQDREQNLSNVLHFIAEQEQYCLRRDEGGKEEMCESNPDSGIASKSSDLSSSEDIIREARSLLTVPEEEESLTSSISTPETILQEAVPLQKQPSTLEASTEAESIIEEVSELHIEEQVPLCEGVLAELKQFAGSDEEVSPHVEEEDSGCPTGWVHVDRTSDFNDPKLRANLMDVMMSRSSSSCSSESGDDHSGYQRLHRLHRSRRHKKASASREGAVRCQTSSRASIIGREDLFLRYGTKEQEAVASFDFLEELTSASSRESTINPR